MSAKKDAPSSRRKARTVMAASLSGISPGGWSHNAPVPRSKNRMRASDRTAVWSS
jgi:hypothetical protein